MNSELLPTSKVQ